MIPISLSEKALELYEELTIEFDIIFQPWQKNYCKVYQENKVATICYNPLIDKEESIAHELLHIWFRKFGISLGNHIYLSTRNDHKLNKFLNKFLCDSITNYCEHFKIYPKYIEMGYSPGKFLSDGLSVKISLIGLKLIILRYLGRYLSSSINFYIGSLFSILADHADNNYSLHHKILKKKR